MKEAAGAFRPGHTSGRRCPGRRGMTELRSGPVEQPCSGVHWVHLFGLRDKCLQSRAGGVSVETLMAPARALLLLPLLLIQAGEV